MRMYVLAAVWLATVGAAFYIGTTQGSSPTETPQDLDREAPQPADAQPGLAYEPSLAPGARRPATRAAENQAPGSTPSRVTVVGEPLEPFTLEDVTTPEEALRRMMLHVSRMLAGGKKGHLALIKFLDENLTDNKELERLFGSEEDGARLIYPMVEFVVHRKDQVVDLVGTVYETMAENPSFFEEIDDDTIEIFTEGVSFVLPGAVTPERLAEMRKHAKAILAKPEDSLPRSIEKNRRDIGRVVQLWAPRLGADDALAKLKSGELTGAEAVAALRRLAPEQVEGLDLGAILAPVVTSGDYRTLRMMQDLPLQPRDIALLDRALLDAPDASRIGEWTLRQYLGATKRMTWPAAQSFIEQGLTRTGRIADASAMCLANVRPRPPQDYIQWVLDSFQLSGSTSSRLKTSFDLK